MGAPGNEMGLPPLRPARFVTRTLELFLLVFPLSVGGHFRKTNPPPASSIVNERDRTSAQAESDVHVILCHSNQSDPQFLLATSRLKSFGYGVTLPDCTHEFSKRYISNLTGRSYNYWGGRVSKYREAVDSLPSETLVLLLDVNDVLILGSAQEAAQRFRTFELPLVASCTEAMWPPPADCPTYLTVPSQFATQTSCRFPCAGALMGTVASIKLLLADDTPINDQCWLHKRLNSWPALGNWTLDVSGQLFLDANRVPQGELRPVAGRYEVDSMQPTIIHMPGLHPRAAALRELYTLAKIADSVEGEP